MKITIKTLKGGKFDVEADPSTTIADVKGIIVSYWCEFVIPKHLVTDVTVISTAVQGKN
jgi:hypothetical protein